MPTPTTRLAPSPTGALHLGNARTFLINWAMARQAGWRVLLRIEDLDGPRIKTGADTAAIEDLTWLGVDWDGPPIYQRADLAPYQTTLETLYSRGLIYQCTCTRSQVAAAQSAPHDDEHELRYPGTCRPKASAAESFSPVTPLTTNDPDTAWRIAVPDKPVEFTDQLHGQQTMNVQQQVGDFIVSTKAGLPAYQLAVVVDDARQGVTAVVRGDDLLRSTARQVHLYRTLGLTPLPSYFHLPLVCGSDGRRLAKRHGDTRIAWYRAQGVPPHRVIGLLAYWSGVIPRREEITAEEFIGRFSLERIVPEPTLFTSEDHEWLIDS